MEGPNQCGYEGILHAKNNFEPTFPRPTCTGKMLNLQIMQQRNWGLTVRDIKGGHFNYVLSIIHYFA